MSVSRRASKLRAQLEGKGYKVGDITWSPIRRGGIMCGPEGGWYVEISQPRPNAVAGSLEGYSIAEMMAQIEELPSLDI